MLKRICKWMNLLHLWRYKKFVKYQFYCIFFLLRYKKFVKYQCYCIFFLVHLLKLCLLWQGLEGLSIGVSDEATFETDDDDVVSSEAGEGIEEIIYIDNKEDILCMDLKGSSPHETRKFEFSSLDMAYEFYNWYARMNGFAARKSKMIKSNKGEILQQNFVCHRQGFREDRGLTIENRKRECKPKTRCGCEAKFRVHIDMFSQRWLITVFTDQHNHELLDEEYHGMLAAHRKMKESDIMQVNDMLKVGIGPSRFYSSLANQSGGYEKIGFRKKDIYNQIGKQRLLKRCDGKNALQYLHGLASNDSMMFYRHTIDGEGRLEHLFWCDGISQLEYNVYGDVLAFDATYGTNKYHCPLVVFSGVNNHNHNVIFAGAIVANEKEETYVWVLEQFLEAMSGKSPISVITDGDLAMKNAIKTVFPNAYHRLCAWHLIRNATSNVGIPEFVGRFRICMLGDYDLGEFRRKWTEMVDTFGLHDNKWDKELYAKRKMWATAHICGKFFAGFRTTSRVEGLHSEMGKFLNSRYNLTDFLLHFHRCLNYMRFKEVEADFSSNYGDPVLQTRFQSMERCAGKLFTREVFLIFRDILARSADMVVTACNQTYTCFIYTVCKYQASKREWNISFYQDDDVFKCSCKKMESFGLPCEHIIALLVFLDVAELPKTLVAPRWTKNAKEAVCSTNKPLPKYWDSHKSARYSALLFRYMRLSKLASESGDDFNDHMEQAAADIQKMETKRGLHDGGATDSSQSDHELLRDPAPVRSKGCDALASSHIRKKRKRTRCSTCREVGIINKRVQYVDIMLTRPIHHMKIITTMTSVTTL